jgi:hypothetical protein
VAGEPVPINVLAEMERHFEEPWTGPGTRSSRKCAGAPAVNAGRPAKFYRRAKEGSSMTTTTVDRVIQKATDPAYTVLSEHGVSQLREYRSQLDKRLETLIQQHESQSTKFEKGKQI